MITSKLSVFRVLSIAVSVVLINGCATLSKEECELGNWQAIGYADGVAGRDSTQLAEHNKACAKVNVAPDYQLWEKGRQEGLKQYCTDANAYRVGKRGHTLNAVCPSAMASRLQRINAKGLSYYNLDSQLTSERRKLDKYNADLEKMRDGDNLDFQTEREARNYLIGLPSKIRRSELSIRDMEESIARLQKKYGY